MKIYQIDSSARKEGSTSRALAKKLLDKIKNDIDMIKTEKYLSNEISTAPFNIFISHLKMLKAY